MRLLWCQTSLKSILRPIGLAAFALYLAWNLLWLARGCIPDSLWHYVTGWPCPTTGGMRSLRALLAGQWSQSLHYNPLTAAYLFLIAATAVVLVRQRACGLAWALPAPLVWAWCAALLVGWIVKFALGPAYW